MSSTDPVLPRRSVVAVAFRVASAAGGGLAWPAPQPPRDRPSKLSPGESNGLQTRSDLSLRLSDLSLRLYAREDGVDGRQAGRVQTLEAHAGPLSAADAQILLASAFAAWRAYRQSELIVRLESAGVTSRTVAGPDGAGPELAADHRLTLAQAHCAQSEADLREAVERCESVFGARIGSLTRWGGMGTRPFLLPGFAGNADSAQ